LAHRYSLCGWIRNLATGDVEVLVEGAKGSVSGFLRELRIGPRHAFISNFQVEWKDYEGKFDSFTVRY
jgi:acylphosphatase